MKCKIKSLGKDFLALTGSVSAGHIFSDLYFAYDSIYTKYKNNIDFTIKATDHTIIQFNHQINYFKNQQSNLIKYRTLDGVYLQMIKILRNGYSLSVIRYSFLQRDLKIPTVTCQIDTLHFKPPNAIFKCFGESSVCEAELQNYIDSNYFNQTVQFSERSVDQVLKRAIERQCERTKDSVGGQVSIVKLTPHTYSWILNPLNCK
ncbi:MAG: hypothetical protein IPL31_05830 [Saprospiraceae bacterium]|nr:hypothetical protein [Saprospiraceae bacterium]